MRMATEPVLSCARMKSYGVFGTGKGDEFAVSLVS